MLRGFRNFISNTISKVSGYRFEKWNFFKIKTFFHKRKKTLKRNGRNKVARSLFRPILVPDTVTQS